MRTSLKIDKLVKLINHQSLEGSWNLHGLIRGDRGGYTQGGISSRAYPELAPLIANGSLSKDQVAAIYRRDYAEQIHSLNFMVSVYPEITALLFFGMVHGSGDNDYISAIQLRLNEFSKYRSDPTSQLLEVDGVFGKDTVSRMKRLSSSQGEQLLSMLHRNKDEFANRRAISVGIAAKSGAIKNRVYNEFLLSKAFGFEVRSLSDKSYPLMPKSNGLKFTIDEEVYTSLVKIEMEDKPTKIVDGILRTLGIEVSIQRDT